VMSLVRVRPAIPVRDAETATSRLASKFKG
jgi:hypothetical protein